MIVSPTFANGIYPWTMDHDQWPAWVQWGMVAGSFGWFNMLFMLFCKIFPSVSMYEVKEMVYHRSLHTKAHGEPSVNHELAAEGGTAS